MRSVKMRRLQIYLDPKMDAHLARLSTKTGKPKAELIRKGIDLLLERETGGHTDSLLELDGIGGEAGYPDASENHDQYLYIREEPSQDQGEKDES